MPEWMSQTAICEDAIKWYHVFEFLIIFGAALWMVAKYATQCGYRNGARWASEEFKDIFGEKKMTVDEECKIVDFILEKEKRCEKLL